MPKWETKITIRNATKRKLKRVTKHIIWGKEKNVPEEIEPGKNDSIEIYAMPGVMTGIEYHIAYEDETPPSADPYGTVEFNVDMPYWKNKNSSSCEVGGIFQKEGFKEIEDGAHDYSVMVTITTSEPE